MSAQYGSGLARLLLQVGRCYVLAMLLMMLCERWLVYPAPRFPQHWFEFPGEHEDVYFRAQDGTQLHGWFFDCENPSGHILICHGNGTNVAYSAAEAARIRERYQHAVFLFDYRGYGRSDGLPDELGVMQDAEAAHSWLLARSGGTAEQLLLWGRSLGGGVSVQLAARHQARALLIECSFDTLTHVAARKFPFLPVKFLMRNHFDSIDRIADYRGPLLQVHGAMDDVVAIEHGKLLFDSVQPNWKRFVTLPARGHNDFDFRDYEVELEQFLALTLPSTSK